MFARARSIAVVAALALAGVGVTTAPAGAASGAKPGAIGPRVVLQDQGSFTGFDVAYDAAGTAYIGWIGSVSTNTAERQVHLCTVRAGTSACAGGAQTISAIGDSTAAGLRVLVTPAGLVTLVWYHEAVVPAYHGRDGRVAEATSQSGGPVTAPADVEDAPSNGEMYDAVVAPDGSLWTATEGTATNSFELRQGITSAPTTVTTPYGPGQVTIAFSGATPVIAIVRAGSITVPVSVSHGGSGFSVVKTWTAGAGIGLVGTKAGVRLIASQDGSYSPVVAKWNGSAFATPKLLGDRNACAPGSHDVGTDASGRVVDLANECGQMTVYNLANTTTAGIVRFSSGGTNAAGPAQIASTPRGHAIAVWGIESPTHVGDRLMFTRVLLPGLDTSVSRSGVTVTGPVSCQPASTIAVSVRGGRAGWKVASAKLTFGGKTLAAKATIDGSKLTPGKVYALTGKVRFTKGGASSSGTATLKFRSCSNP